ncbi:MAG: photosynthetic reaction center subunit H [Pseudomonadota bacterium]
MVLQQFGNFTGHIDLALVALYVFWAFFFWLVLYLQQEGRREGFPLVGELDGKSWNQDLWMPSPKTFETNDGRTVQAPDDTRADTRNLNMEMVVGGVGSPFVPTGNPMTDAVGPASFSERPDIPDTTFELRPRIIPMRIDSDFEVAKQDIDPRGSAIYGCDGVEAGTIMDLWVDRSDFVIRYAEVELPAAAPVGDEPAAPAARVLIPWTLVNYTTNRDLLQLLISVKKQEIVATFSTNALTAEQFAGIPMTRSPDQITLLEEDQIMSYVGGGRLYATPQRQEPWI